ncbi:MAG: hypothetical protein ABIR65_01190 [Pseudolysinimonas sp.]
MPTCPVRVALLLAGLRRVSPTSDLVARDHLADELRAALNLCERVGGRHNYNDSDSMTDHFDVGYHLTVDAHTVEAAALQGIALERDPDLATLHARAEAASKRLGPKCTKSVLGRGGLTTAGEWSLRHILHVDEHAAGRPVAYDKSRRAWLPVAD